MSESTPAPAPVKGFKFSNLVTDKTKETDGVWLEPADGFRLKIARLGNTKYEEALNKAIKPYLKQIRIGKPNVPEIEKATVKAIANYVLLDWEGLLDEKEQLIPYSPQKAEELLLESKDFQKLVLQLAQDSENFRRDLNEESAGN